eukprot:44069-Eustigmatos_ZCMA.PRE.1
MSECHCARPCTKIDQLRLLVPHTQATTSQTSATSVRYLQAQARKMCVKDVCIEVTMGAFKGRGYHTIVVDNVGRD